MAVIRRLGYVFLFTVLVFSSVSQAANQSIVAEDTLSVPRIDFAEYGSVALSFRIDFSEQPLLILEDLVEVTPDIANAGAYDPTIGVLDLDEVLLETGEIYSVRLSLVENDEAQVFTVTEAVHLNPQLAVNSPSNSTLEEAGLLYGQDCASCHGDNGNGTAIAPPLLACANCGSASVLSNYIQATMPLGQAGSCDSTCANMLADYVLTVFNADNAEVVSETVGFIEQLNDGTTLRRVAQQLVSRLPQAHEFELVGAQGSDGLATVIAGMMEEDAFLERLKEIFNDYLLTDKYHSRNGAEAAINLLRSDDFPERRWFDPGNGNRPENYESLRRDVNDAVAREPLELIAYVTKNDLPFTEIVTADYMMLNSYSAQTYGVEGLPFSDPDDPNEYLPAQLEDIPHAGILTSPMFLNRYPTTSTNLNRGRARVVFDLFLDTDILAIEGVRPGNAVDITTPIPTINNPQCSKCHSVLDPVASTFQNWNSRGQYRPARLTSSGWPTDIEPRGFNGQPMPLAGNIDSSLQWLGQQIANDPKFPRAVTRIVMNGLTGKEPLDPPDEATATQAEIDAYIAERTFLNEMQERFVADDYKLKTLVREILLSPYWRASGLSGQAIFAQYENTGSSYLLTPEELDRKIESLFGFDWRESLDNYHRDKHKSYMSRLGDTFHQIYGGIDSDSIVTRLRSPNGLMGAMQIRMANELACYGVPHDFWRPEGERLLFPFVDSEVSPYNEAGILDEAAMVRIRDNIQYLHNYLLNEHLLAGTEELRLTEQLFMNTLNRGRQLMLVNGDDWRVFRLPDKCDRTYDFEGNSLETDSEDNRLYEDRLYVIRAWMAVVAYLLADYRFLYQ